MTQDEQKQVDHLQQQLIDSKQKVEQIRGYLMSALGKSNDEARFYRGLFWCLLFLMMAVTIVHFFQK